MVDLLDITVKKDILGKLSIRGKTMTDEEREEAERHQRIAAGAILMNYFETHEPPEAVKAAFVKLLGGDHLRAVCDALDVVDILSEIEHKGEKNGGSAGYHTKKGYSRKVKHKGEKRGG